jgi:hypothetical protein
VAIRERIDSGMAGHLELLHAATVRAAELLESGFGVEVTRREERLRRAFVAALSENPEVVEVVHEWRPEMSWWPWRGSRRLGGFDLAIRFEGENSFSTVAELKWCQRTGLDAFDEVLWDAFKLAHAKATLAGIKKALLVYAAPVPTWQVDGRFRTFFDDSLSSTETLLSEHANVWRWLLRTSSHSRPTKLPPEIETTRIPPAAFQFDGGPWELRVASVAPNGEPWLDLDDGWPVTSSEPDLIEWPYPEPGPGMVPDDPASDFRWPWSEPPQVPNDELRPEDVPSSDATWSEIEWFAAQFDGYGHYRGNERLAEVANGVRAAWDDDGSIPPKLSLSDLRGCLFFATHSDARPRHQARPGSGPTRRRRPRTS